MNAFGHIDFLINNVGVGLYGYPTEVDTDMAKRLFDINVFAPLALTQLVIPHMREQSSGFVVNVGSVGGKVSLPGRPCIVPRSGPCTALTIPCAVN